MQLKYRLVACDCDGTFLKNDFTVSERNIAAVTDYIKRGGVFTLATGRSFETVSPYLPLVGLDKIAAPIICNMGANVVSSVDGKTIYAEYIECNCAAKFSNLLTRYNTDYLLNTSDGLVINRMTQLISDYIEMLNIKKVHNANGYIHDYIINNRINCLKFLVFLPEDKCPNILKEIRSDFSDLFTVQSTAPLLDGLRIDGKKAALIESVTSNASKGNALKAVADLLNIPIEQTMAIGDSFNDLAMLKAAGLGVAMDNACKEVKDEAGYITAGNNEDGVALALEKFCVGEKQ